MNDEQDTSWESVSDWYQNLITDEKSYQNTLILPNVLRLLNIKKGEAVLDLACGPGLFSVAVARAGAVVTGVDASRTFIKLAQENTPKNLSANFSVSLSNKLSGLKNDTFDKVFCVLALQNIKELTETISEVKRVLKPNGTFIFVLNHPAFRIPGATSWQFDEKENVQFRRASKYMSEETREIIMNPGKKNSEKTYSFHRPLQSYFKSLKKNGFVVSNLEEWISDKTSKGARAKAENTARKEFPLFMAIVTQKLIQ